MKRRLLILLLLLVAGAIINVAVAWGVFCRPLPRTSLKLVRSSDEESVGWWRKHAPPPYPDQPTDIQHLAAFGVQVTSLIWDQGETSSTPRARNVATRLQTGWPLHCLQGGVWTDPWNDPWITKDQPTRQFVLRARLNRDYLRDLPYGPIWPGFAINTVFYAAILWLLFAAPFALRRRRRIKRGLCPKCAYPVGTNERCTECGATVAPATQPDQ